MTYNTSIVAAMIVALLPFATSCMSRKNAGAKKKKEKPAESTTPSEKPGGDDPADWGEIGGSSAESQSSSSYGDPTPSASTTPFNDPYNDPYASDIPTPTPSLSPSPSAEAGTRGDRGSLSELDKYVGTWDGTSNLPDPKAVWEIADADPSDAGTDDDSKDFFDGNSGNADEVDCTSSAARNSSASVFIFKIPAGTGANGAYNSRANPCVVKSGKKLRFVNEDNVDHMPHFNSRICPHPDVPADTLRKDSNPSWECTARNVTNGITELYDHLAGIQSGANFYIEVVQ
jgi:hypothetical protein